MYYPEWHEDRLSFCQECGGVIDGDPSAGEVGQPGEVGHKFLCQDCFVKHENLKKELRAQVDYLGIVSGLGIWYARQATNKILGENVL
jgi:hypothetical protein